MANKKTNIELKKIFDSKVHFMKILVSKINILKMLYRSHDM